jgi:hypothetical protein
VVDGLPLIVVVVLDVHIAVDYRLHHIREEEHRNHWPDKSGPVARWEQVHHSITFERAKGLPVLFVCGLQREGYLLFAKAGNLHIDVCFEFGLNFESLDHLDDLRLLFGGAAISRADFL